jgi:hypothetical protein
MGGQNSEERAVLMAQSMFPGAKVRLPRSKASTEADFLIHARDQRLAVKLKAIGTARLSDLEGNLASATLAAHRVARKTGSQPLVMIEMPRLGPRSMAFSRQFMAREAPDTGWCLYDRDGGFCFEIPSLGIVGRSESRARTGPRPQPTRGALFSDLQRWMLKILLMREVSPRFWGGPTQGIQSVRDLAMVAKVSQQTAYSFVRAFETAGYLREGDAGIVIVRRGELMRAWLNHDAAFYATRIPVQSLLGSSHDLSKTLARLGDPERFAITGFEACRLMGVLHAPVPWREVCFVGDVAAVIADWRLKPCDPRDADFMLSKMAFPKSILRGRAVQSNVPVVDILEAAISVSGQAPRGHEQASHIFEHVLGWSDCT